MAQRWAFTPERDGKANLRLWIMCAIRTTVFDSLSAGWLGAEDIDPSQSQHPMSLRLLLPGLISPLAHDPDEERKRRTGETSLRAMSSITPELVIP